MFEGTAATGVIVHPNGVAMVTPGSSSTSSGPAPSNGNGAAAAGAPAGQGRGSEAGCASSITGRLLIDCMGNFSPIVRQARWGQTPDGVCLVVGSCCRGFTKNTTGALHSLAPEPCSPSAFQAHA